MRMEKIITLQVRIIKKCYTEMLQSDSRENVHYLNIKILHLSLT